MESTSDKLKQLRIVNDDEAAAAAVEEYDDCNRPLQLKPAEANDRQEDLDLDEDEDDNDDRCSGDEPDDEDAQYNRESFQVNGLFSPEQTFQNVVDMFNHELKTHRFNLIETLKRYDMDMISYIKMINFIRAKKPEPSVFSVDYKDGVLPWSCDEYMRTVVDNDAALQFDIEEDLDMLNVADSHKTTADDESVATIRKLKSQLNESNAKIEQLTDLVDKLKQFSNNLLTKPTTKKRAHDSENSTSSSSSDDEDANYKESYSNYSIHLEMLQDTVRTEGYMNAILKNAAQFKDKIVLDVGCGSGILSLFAAKAGAKLVVAVDMSNIIEQAIQIAKENKLDDKIVFIRGKIEEVKLPVDHVDIIISEWMGYFLVYESMLDSVIYARDKYLKPFATNSNRLLVLPNKFDMHLFAVSDETLFAKKIKYWDDVYGFKMSCMKPLIIRDAQVRNIEQEKVISDLVVMKHIDCESCKLEDIKNFSYDFELKIDRDAKLTAIASSFDTYFNHELLDSKSSFSTSPFHESTHWEQTMFQLDDPVAVSKGQLIRGRIECSKNPNYNRSYLVNIHLFDKLLKYIIE